MSGIVKNAPLSYRIRVEKRDKFGGVELIGDTGFVKPQTKRLIQFLLELLNIDIEREKQNGIQ